MQYNEQEKLWIWLASVAGMNARKFDALLSAFDTPACVWEEGTEETLSPVVGRATASMIAASRNTFYLEAFLQRLESLDIRALARVSDTYPEMLRHIDDAPPVLYTRGRSDVSFAKSAAVVGSRNASRYGREMAVRIAGGLGANGVTVVSGLARGIDTCAQVACMEAGGVTVGVLGCGLDVVYPPENREVFQRVMQVGMLVSEYPPGTKPLGAHFPARNRIISGLAHAVVLIEAQEKSGTMITVRHAQTQGREVFAVPANITAPSSYWPNRLIQEGAAVVLDAQDILSEMRWNTGSHALAQGGRASLEELVLSPQEALVVAALTHGEATFDELCQMTALPAQILNVHLTSLELREIIEQFPGKIIALHRKYGP
nr:DNA-processing protein DprA [Maliibacterium massiliense]